MIFVMVALLSSLVENHPCLAQSFDEGLLGLTTRAVLQTIGVDESGAKQPETKAAGECCRPTTLFQWSYGTVTNGPDPAASLNTDRPDFTESSRTVGLGITQWEMGYTYTFDDDGVNQARAHTYPEALLRVGLFADWLELRVGWLYLDQVTRSGGISSSLQGSEDLYLGMKIALTPQDGCLPSMALIPQMTIPTGTTGISAGETLPGLNWTYSWDLSDTVSIAGQTQINRALDQVTSQPFLDFSQAASVGFAITERLAGYAEWYTLVPDGADTDATQHYVNTGLTLAVSEFLQYDARVGYGLSDEADDYFVGGGLVFRY